MMYKFGQHDIKFLVVCVKYHMKTDVLITPLALVQKSTSYLFDPYLAIGGL